MTPAVRETLVTAATLLVFSVVGATLLSGTFGLTRAQISASEEREKLAQIAEVLPTGGFNNDPVQDALPLPPDPLLGLRQTGQAYQAKLDGKPVAVVLEAVAREGYAGDINLLIGIDASGHLTGVRVTAHKETPGLGDYIEASKGRWIRQFDGKGLDAPPTAADWKVRKDGGRFDYMAGATITPRAVIKTVHQALQYFQAHREALLPSEPGLAPSTSP